MNINKENLEILIIALVGQNILATTNGNGEKNEFCWHELLINLTFKEKNSYLDIHYIYELTHRDIDFKNQIIKNQEVIEFTLSAITNDSKESLERLEKNNTY